MSALTVRELLAVRKHVGKVSRTPKSHQSHVELNFTLESEWDGQLKAFFRANVELPESFSFGLRAKAKDGRGWMNLLRVNGDHGGHRNPDGQLISDAPHVHLVADLEALVDAAEDSTLASPLDPSCNQFLPAWHQFTNLAGIDPSPEIEARLWQVHSTLGQLNLDV